AKNPATKLHAASTNSPLGRRFGESLGATATKRVNVFRAISGRANLPQIGRLVSGHLSGHPPVEGCHPVQEPSYGDGDHDWGSSCLLRGLGRSTLTPGSWGLGSPQGPSPAVRATLAGGTLRCLPPWRVSPRRARDRQMWDKVHRITQAGPSRADGKGVGLAGEDVPRDEEPPSQAGRPAASAGDRRQLHQCPASGDYTA